MISRTQHFSVYGGNWFCEILTPPASIPARTGIFDIGCIMDFRLCGNDTLRVIRL